jgi:hypothetical protein
MQTIINFCTLKWINNFWYFVEIFSNLFGTKFKKYMFYYLLVWTNWLHNSNFGHDKLIFYIQWVSHDSLVNVIKMAMSQITCGHG